MKKEFNDIRNMTSDEAKAFAELGFKLIINDGQIVDLVKEREK